MLAPLHYLQQKCLHIFNLVYSMASNPSLEIDTVSTICNFPDLSLDALQFEAFYLMYYLHYHTY